MILPYALVNPPEKVSRNCIAVDLELALQIALLRIPPGTGKLLLRVEAARVDSKFDSEQLHSIALLFAPRSPLISDPFAHYQLRKS